MVYECIIMTQKKKMKKRYVYHRGHEDVKEIETQSNQGNKKVNKLNSNQLMRNGKEKRD